MNLLENIRKYLLTYQFWVLVIFFCSINIFGQKQQITKQEYFTPYEKASKNMKELPYRVKIKRYIFRDSKLQYETHSVNEIVPPNKRRYVTQIIDPRGVINLESIFIGDFIYRKDRFGNWTKKVIEKNRKEGIEKKKSVKSKAKTIQIQYFYVGRLKFEDQYADVYESERIFEYELKSKRVVSLTRERRWIGENGLIVKFELETELLNPKKLVSKSIAIHEYNPKNLIIEAPIE